MNVTDWAGVLLLFAWWWPTVNVIASIGKPRPTTYTPKDAAVAMSMALVLTLAVALMLGWLA